MPTAKGILQKGTTSYYHHQSNNSYYLNTVTSCLKFIYERMFKLM